MVGAIQSLVRGFDAEVARLYLRFFQERHALLTFLFHSLFRDEREIASSRVDPLERTTVQRFRQFIEYYLEAGYRFISLTDLFHGIGPEGKYALITFDDGYFNNTLARPILEEYGVPAAFFISTNHVQQNKCFWWDVLHRELAARGVAAHQIYREGIALKSLRTERIEEELRSRFGPGAFTPGGDIDRPFAPDELRDFASSRYVTLGNHTANHAILTNYTDEEVRAQVADAQEALRRMSGVAPLAIAYPNGAQSQRIFEICAEVGLKIGFTVRPAKSALPLDWRSPNLLRLGRFCTNGDDPILNQCRTYRSDLLIYGAFRDRYLRFFRGQVAQ